MKKFFLPGLLLTILLAGITMNATAQYSAVLGSRFIVNAPFSLQGVKPFTYSQDPAYSGPWGGRIDSPYIYRVPLVNIADSLGGTAYTQAEQVAVNGKWVLIFRGTYEFGLKALHAQQGGAKGIVIVNNIPGSAPVGMAAGTYGGSVTIPVVMIGNADGLALNAALDAGQADTISLASWGFGLAHDLTMVTGSAPVPYMGAMPLAQLVAGPTTPQYNMYNGGFVANIGSNTETGVVINTAVTFTNSSNVTTTVNTDTIQLGSIAVADSMNGNYSGSVYHPVPTTTGHYNTKTFVTLTNTDNDAADDTLSYTSYVTDSVFCMGHWDPVNNQPIPANGGESFASGPNTWGPLIYMQDGPYQAVKVQFAVNDNDTSKHDLTKNTIVSGTGAIFVMMFKWVDGSNGQPADTVIQEGELTLAGIGSKAFTTTDSNDKMFFVNLGDINQTAGSGAYTAAQSTYFFAADLGDPANQGVFMDIDGYTNYFSRTITAKEVGKTNPFVAPNANVTVSSLETPQDPTVAMDVIPFTTITDPTTLTLGNLRSFDKFTPAMAVYMSKNHANSVANVTNAKPQFAIYPNPVVSTNLHAKLDLAVRSSKVVFGIEDGFGRGVYHVTKTNLQNEDVELPTSNLAPGQYYLSIMTDNGTMSKPFTVLAK